jgi:hypothetical protein
MSSGHLVLIEYMEMRQVEFQDKQRIYIITDHTLFVSSSVFYIARKMVVRAPPQDYLNRWI